MIFSRSEAVMPSLFCPSIGEREPRRADVVMGLRLVLERIVAALPCTLDDYAGLLASDCLVP